MNRSRSTRPFADSRCTLRTDRGIVPSHASPRTLPLPLPRPLTGKWVRARYVAERHEIAARYTEWEIIGPPEIRHADPEARYFTPWKVLPHAELVRPEDPRAGIAAAP